MIQSIIFDTVPEQLEIDGEVHQINFGYRTMMAIEIEMFGKNSDEQKLLTSLNLFYKNDIPKNISEAIEKMMWFHRCGREKEKKKSVAPARMAKTRRAYCFKQDAPLIYAAFRQQYDIDLKKTLNRELHWWEFIALFEALNEDTKMAKVIYWRTCDISGLSKKQKEHVLKMRGLYQLEEAQTDVDAKVKLAKRNADMKEYVRRRTQECIRKE